MSAFLASLAQAPCLAPAGLLGGRALTVLAPHPDDETLGCGALLFDAAASGLPCTVICVTDGSRSHPNSRQWPAPRLAEERRREFVAAVRILAPAADLHWLGHPDCAAPDSAVDAPAVAERIPAGSTVLATWQGDPHIDHERVARLARHIGALRPDLTFLFYPVWGRFTDRIAPAQRLIATPAALAAKRRALAAYRTQMTGLIDDDPAGFVMEEWRQQHFLTHPEVVIAD